jgi:toxin ParE1/3/4
MPHVIRTARAKRDLAEIWHYIATDNIAAADRLIDSFDASIQLLAEHPGLGPARSYLGRDVRTFPVGNYLIYYRSIAGGVELLRVMHGARDVRDLGSS